ncbi:hypothetical protein STEG23_025573 [Scotinomys teguina]
MDKENVVHIHNGVLRSRENNDIMKFAGKWMELENVILSECYRKCDLVKLSSQTIVYDSLEEMKIRKQRHEKLRYFLEVTELVNYKAKMHSQLTRTILDLKSEDLGSAFNKSKMTLKFGCFL